MQEIKWLAIDWERIINTCLVTNVINLISLFVEYNATNTASK